MVLWIQETGAPGKTKQRPCSRMRCPDSGEGAAGPTDRGAAQAGTAACLPLRGVPGTRPVGGSPGSQGGWGGRRGPVTVSRAGRVFLSSLAHSALPQTLERRPCSVANQPRGLRQTSYPRCSFLSSVTKREHNCWRPALCRAVLFNYVP